MRLEVAFQGELGAFSQEAIRQLLGSSAIPRPRQRWDEVFQSVASGEVPAAVVPLENTLHGSVHDNYDLLLKHGFAIRGETQVRIVHNLIAPTGTRFKDIRTVYSHPVAINQCLDFFAANPQVARHPFYDTAGSVKMIMEERPVGAAAIASELAARQYGGAILKRGIEDDPKNFTRFVVLQPPDDKPIRVKSSGPWKTSIVFSTKNQAGALFRSLAALALRDINLVKIESRPLKGRPWEYLFYLDFLGRETDSTVSKALSHLSETADFLRVLGSYRSH